MSADLELSWVLYWHDPIAGYSLAHAPELTPSEASALRQSVPLPLDARSGSGWDRLFRRGDVAVAARYGSVAGNEHDRRASHQLQVLIAAVDSPSTATAGQLAAALLSGLDQAPATPMTRHRGGVHVDLPDPAELVARVTDQVVDAAAALTAGEPAWIGSAEPADVGAVLSLLPRHLAEDVVVCGVEAPPVPGRPTLNLGAAPIEARSPSAKADRYRATLADLRQHGKSFADIAAHLAAYTKPARPSAVEELADLLPGREIAREIQALDSIAASNRSDHLADYVIPRARWVVERKHADDQPHLPLLRRFLLDNYAYPQAREFVDANFADLRPELVEALRAGLETARVPEWLAAIPDDAFDDLVGSVVADRGLSLGPPTADALFAVLIDRSPAIAGALFAKVAEEQQEQLASAAIAGGLVHKLPAALAVTDPGTGLITTFHADLLSVLGRSTPRPVGRMRNETLLSFASALRKAGIANVRTPLNPNYVIECVRWASNTQHKVRERYRRQLGDIGEDAAPAIGDALAAGGLTGAEVASVVDIPQFSGVAAELAAQVLRTDHSRQVLNQLVWTVRPSEWENDALRGVLVAEPARALSVLAAAVSPSWHEAGVARRLAIVYAVLQVAAAQRWTHYVRLAIDPAKGPEVDLHAALDDLVALAAANSVDPYAVLANLMTWVDKFPRSVFVADPAPVTVLFGTLLRSDRAQLRTRLTVSSPSVEMTPAAQAAVDALGGWADLEQPSRNREHAAYATAAASFIDSYAQVLPDLVRAAQQMAHRGSSQQDRAVKILLSTTTDTAARELVWLLDKVGSSSFTTGTLRAIVSRLAAMSPMARPGWVPAVQPLLHGDIDTAVPAVADALFHHAPVDLLTGLIVPLLDGRPSSVRVTFVAMLAAQPEQTGARRMLRALCTPRVGWTTDYVANFEQGLRRTVDVLASAAPANSKRRHNWLRRRKDAGAPPSDGVLERVKFAVARQRSWWRDSWPGLLARSLMPLALAVVAFVAAGLSSAGSARRLCVLLGTLLVIVAAARVAFAVSARRRAKNRPDGGKRSESR